MSEDTRIIYSVEILGHEPPFEWRIYKQQPHQQRPVGTGISGVVDSIPEAIDAGNDAVRAMEYQRKHAKVKRSIVLLEVDETVPDAEDIPDTFPESWPEA